MLFRFDSVSLAGYIVVFSNFKNWALPTKRINIVELYSPFHRLYKRIVNEFYRLKEINVDWECCFVVQFSKNNRRPKKWCRPLLVLPTAFSQRHNNQRKSNKPKDSIAGSGGPIRSHLYILKSWRWLMLGTCLYVLDLLLTIALQYSFHSFSHAF